MICIKDIPRFGLLHTHTGQHVTASCMGTYFNVEYLIFIDEPRTRNIFEFQTERTTVSILRNFGVELPIRLFRRIPLRASKLIISVISFLQFGL